MDYIEVHTFEDPDNSWWVRIESIDRVVRQPYFTTIVVKGLLMDCIESYEYIEGYVARNNRNRIKLEGTDW